MKTEHEECRKTEKRSKRGNLQDECDKNIENIERMEMNVTCTKGQKTKETN